MSSLENMLKPASNNSQIFLVASNSTDILKNANGELLDKRLGGPLFFAERVFDQCNFPYRKALSQPALVEITVYEGDEVGKFVEDDKINLPVFIEEDNLLVTAISPRAVNLEDLLAYKGTTFLDLQSFSRGLGTGSFDDEHFITLTSNAIVKGTVSEFSKVSTYFGERFTPKLKLITNGSLGVCVFNKGSHTDFPVPEVVLAKDTIGAGDTFFAAFISRLVLDESVEDSIIFAQEFTTNFLKRKI